MRITNYILLILILITTSCDFAKNKGLVVPDYAEKFSENYIENLKKGNIEQCFKMLPESDQTESTRQKLTYISSMLSSYPLENKEIVRSNKSFMRGKTNANIYMLEYEYRIKGSYFYFGFELWEENNQLDINKFDSINLKVSFREIHALTFNNKSIYQVLFLLVGIMNLLFILFTFIFSFKYKLKRKWLWRIGILIGFCNFYINWTTGEFNLNFLSFNFLGFGIVRQSEVTPWIISIYLPVIALFFWGHYFDDLRKKKIEENTEFQYDEIL